MKCRYKYCLHETKDIPKGEEVSDNKLYYHADCLKTKNEIVKIATTFGNKINPNVVWAQLYRTINNIVFEKHISSELLLFGLNYYIEHKIPLNYPQGLYYVIQNKEMLAAYDKLRLKNVKQKMNEEISNGYSEEENTRSFGYIGKKITTISDILGG